MAVCPECGDDSRTCEHRCFDCDRICPTGTCTNARCESCCDERCEEKEGMPKMKTRKPLTYKVDRRCPRCRAHRMHRINLATEKVLCCECGHDWQGRLKPDERPDPEPTGSEEINP